MNQSNFLDLKKKGVRLSKPQHYAQMQIYMGRLRLKKALYVALNKNTCDLYFEDVNFDEDRFEDLEDLESDIINAKHVNEFPQISHNPSWYSCKYCNAKEVCHEGAPVLRNCRTCNNVEIGDFGHWYCNLENCALSEEAQEAGCGEWECAKALK